MLTHTEREHAAALRDWRAGCPRTMWGGAHLCGDANPYSALAAHQGNYMHKMFAAVRLCEQRNLTHLASLDDDVLVSPGALRALLQAVPRADARGCHTLSPTLSTGIPSVERFADAFLGAPARAMLRECFTATTLGRFSGIYDFSALNPMPAPWGDGRAFFSAIGARRGVMAFNGIHPVRANATCNALATELAAARIDALWLRNDGDGDEDGLFVEHGIDTCATRAG